MRTAHNLACCCLPKYSSKFSRKDFTLPQLFACLVVKEHQKRSYRGAEALLKDADSWLRDIGLRRAPDHNTLCRAAAVLLLKCRVDKLLDQVAKWGVLARLLGLSTKPLTIDSTIYESRHVSRHYERRCHQTRQRMRAKDAAKGLKSSRSDTIGRLPKLAIGVASHSHLILSVWTGTGAGGDHPHFEKLVFDAWRRVPNRSFKIVADAGYDSEDIHRLARLDMGLKSLIPPTIGRPSKDGKRTGRFRQLMQRLLGTKRSRRRSGYTQRQQVEAANSMMKRNLGSALAGRTANARKRDMRLKALTHDVMIFRRRGSRQSRSLRNAIRLSLKALFDRIL